MEILIKNAQRKQATDSKQLKKQIAQVLEFLEQQNCELSVLLTSDEKIRELNLSYREKDSATDVLSFPQDEDAINEQGEALLGDVVISVETAARQAMEHGLDLGQELALLSIHGILHLLGYDHETSEEDALYMKRTTSELMNELFPGVTPSKACPF